MHPQLYAAGRAKHAGVVGDTLFALGCGRMFEGNAQQMWTSLSKMKPLPPNTKVFCAHEYTQSNAKFALSVDPDNQALQKRAALINDLRKKVRLYVLRSLTPAAVHMACHNCAAQTGRAG